jgi:hypothetical protein
MNNDRIAPQQRFAADIQRMLATVRELKNAQRLGSDSLVGYLTHSDNLNDFSTPMPGFATKVFRLRFTHDTAKHGSIQQLAFFWSISQPDTMSFYVPPWANGPAISSVIEKQQPTDTYNDWIFRLTRSEEASPSQRTGYLG